MSPLEFFGQLPLAMQLFAGFVVALFVVTLVWSVVAGIWVRCPGCKTGKAKRRSKVRIASVLIAQKDQTRITSTTVVNGIPQSSRQRVRISTYDESYKCPDCGTSWNRLVKRSRPISGLL